MELYPKFGINNSFNRGNGKMFYERTNLKNSLS